MNAFHRHLIIQRIKVLAEVHGQINYGRIAATKLYDYSVKGSIKRIVYSLFYAVEVFFHKKNERLLIVYSSREKGREDYDRIHEDCLSLIDGKGDILEVKNRLSFFRIFAILFAAKFYKTIKPEGLCFIDRLSVALLMAKYHLDYKKISKIPLNYECMISFCDANPYENMLTQMATLNNIPSITNQHGQYRILTAENMSADAEAYSNFISSKMLVWGQATVDEFSRYGVSSERLVKFGRLGSAPIDNLKTEIDQIKERFGVILNGENGKKYNYMLIDVANQLAELTGCRFIVRLHPANNPPDYLSLVSEMCESIQVFSECEYYNRVDFSIAHMTGVLIEAISREHSIYLLDKDLPEVFKVDSMLFCSAEELKSKIEVSASNDFSKMKKHFLHDCDQRKVLSEVIDSVVTV